MRVTRQNSLLDLLFTNTVVMQGRGEPRNMTYKPPRLAAIFLMPILYRPGGGSMVPLRPPPPGYATIMLIELNICVITIICATYKPMLLIQNYMYLSATSCRLSRLLKMSELWTRIVQVTPIAVCKHSIHYFKGRAVIEILSRLA